MSIAVGSPKTLKLGTRRSLLAWAQSQWVAHQIEKKCPGVSVELVGIETKGDQIQNIPLSKIEGKEFFVAELDEALKSGRVDFCVHSLKDLSLDRPSEFILAAIPLRENPRDVILFHEDVLKNIAQGRAVKVGTSSPRRLYNLPDFLKHAMPRQQKKIPKIEFVEIRGNINTRLGRLHEKSDSPKKLDGVVLAMAGLNRLNLDEKARLELQELLKSTRFMVLPLAQNPTAPAQGALAVECRRKDQDVVNALKTLHSEETEKSIRIERDILKEWGGGCHQKLGATAVFCNGLGTVTYVRGERPDGSAVNELRWNAPAPEQSGSSFLSSKHRPFSESSINISHSQLAEHDLWFLSHSRALPQGVTPGQEKRIWVSGAESWFRLAELGFWVEGCTESLGFQLLDGVFTPSFFKNPKSIAYLNHYGEAEEFTLKKGIPVSKIISYSLKEEPIPGSVVEEIKKSKQFYWTSYSQYLVYKKYVDQNQRPRHFCGPGRTAELLKKEGVAVTVFPNSKEWLKWLK